MFKQKQYLYYILKKQTSLLQLKNNFATNKSVLTLIFVKKLNFVNLLSQIGLTPQSLFTNKTELSNGTLAPEMIGPHKISSCTKKIIIIRRIFCQAHVLTTVIHTRREREPLDACSIGQPSEKI